MLRLNYIKAAPRPYEYLSTLSHYFHDCGLPDGLVELVWLRASQLNGCAYCIDMHVTDALKVGIEPRRVHLLDAWRETELYSPAERAALAWTEAVTNVQDGHVPDDVFAELDQARRRMLATAVAGYEQVLITAAVLDDVPETLTAHTVRIEAGTIVGS